MNKCSPIKLLMWYVLSAPSLASILYFLVPQIPPSLVSYSLWGSEVIKFEHRLNRFKNYSPNRIIIIGPSYAEQIGEPAGMHNLSFPTLRLSEMGVLLEKHCSPNERIFLFCSMMDDPKAEVRPFVVNTIERKLELAKSLLPRAGEEPIDIDEFLRLLKRDCAGKTEPELDYSGYDALSRKYPFIVFVIHPVRCSLLYESFADEMNAKYDTIDLTGIILPKHMKDFLHFNEVGINLVRQQLLAYQSTEPAF